MADSLEHRAGLTRVLIVAEQAFARVGLRTLLADREEISVVGEASSLEEASAALNELGADVVLSVAGANPSDWATSPPDGVGVTTRPILLLGGEPAPAE